jgi:hypothetical protein
VLDRLADPILDRARVETSVGDSPVAVPSNMRKEIFCMKQFVEILTLLGVAGSVVIAQTLHPQISTSYVAKDRPVLENYSFQLGMPAGSPNASAGAELHFKDRFVGN